jgi:hypothetical protein
MTGDGKSPLKVKGRQNDMEKTVKYHDGMDVGFIIDSTNCGLCKKVGVGTWHIVLYFSIKNRTSANIRITNLNAKLDIRPSSDSALTVGSREVVDLRNKDSLLRENKYYDLVPNEEQPITGELEAVSWFRSPSNRIDSQCALLFSLSVDYRAIESDRTFNVVIPVFYWFDSDVSSGQSNGRLVCITKYNVKELIEQNKDKKTIVETLREISKEIVARSSHAELIWTGQRRPPSQHRYPKEEGESVNNILFLAADPTDAARLRLGEELREIQEKLQLAKLRKQFKLEQRMSVRPADISQALLDIQPQIVHFSGHGTATGALCFENQIGETHPIEPEALAALFEQFADQVSCVLLNACYSETQANAIARYIDYVIGMNQAIDDKAAIAFAIGFYQALGAGRTIEEAYKLGCVQIRLQGIPEHLTPVLIKKEQAHP